MPQLQLEEAQRGDGAVRLEDLNDVEKVNVVLSQLAASARHRRALVTASSEAALRAIDCGEVLLAAKALVAPGRWTEWVAIETGIARPTAERYMRLAAYKTDVTAWLSSGGSGSLTGALDYLAGIPTYDASTRKQHERAAQAIGLRSFGVSTAAIAHSIGTACKAVRTYVDPAIEERKRGARRAMAARRRRRLETLRNGSAGVRKVSPRLGGGGC